MSEPFAKLFDTPHGQLLVYLTTSADADEDIIRVVGPFVNGVQTAAAMSGYSTSEAVRAAFDKFDQAGADGIAADFHRVAGGLAA